MTRIVAVVRNLPGAVVAKTASPNGAFCWNRPSRRNWKQGGAPVPRVRPENERVATIDADVFARQQEHDRATPHARIAVAWKAGERVMFLVTLRKFG